MLIQFDSKHSNVIPITNYFQFSIFCRAPYKIHWKTQMLKRKSKCVFKKWWFCQFRDVWLCLCVLQTKKCVCVWFEVFSVFMCSESCVSISLCNHSLLFYIWKTLFELVMWSCVFVCTFFFCFILVKLSHQP